MLRRFRLDRIGYVIFGAFVSAVLFPYLRDPFFVPILDSIGGVSRQYPYFVIVASIILFCCLGAILLLVANIGHLRTKSHELEMEADGLKKYVELATYKARTDPKTGIPNDEALQLQLTRSIEKVREDDVAKIAVIYIDLNNLGQINKTHGSRFGDVIISRFAQIVESDMRRVEIIARRATKGDRATNQFENLRSRDTEFFRKNTGGDEFVFVLEESIDGAIGFLKRILDKTVPKIEVEVTKVARERDFQTVEHLSIGFCAGVTKVEKSDSAESLLDWAEQLLWDAKNARRELPQCTIAIGSRSAGLPATKVLLRTEQRDERGNAVWRPLETA